MRSFKTLDTLLFDLRKRGFRLDFVYHGGMIRCPSAGLSIPISNIRIEEVHSLDATGTYIRCHLYGVSTLAGTRGIIFDFERTRGRNTTQGHAV